MARKAAIYLRSSKDRHDVSVESQRRELIAHIEAEGNLLAAEFVDKVESAKTDNRPGFQEMIEEVKQKNRRFDVVYCFDTSRFARRQYHAQMYKHLLKKHSVELRFLKLPKTDTILDTIIESLMEAFDEFHSQKSKMDGLRGMRENIEQGYRAGGRAVLGYKLDKHVVGTRDGNPITKSKLVPDPKMFPVIQQYMKGRAQGVARKALIEQLGLDIPYTTLLYSEDNALAYAGHTVWNRHNEMIDGSYVGGKKFRDRSEWVVKKDTHEAMISDEEAEAILASRNETKQKTRRYRVNHYLLSGLIQCNCGANMDGDSGFYRCHDRCGTRGIKKETLEEAVLELLFDEVLTLENLAELKEAIAEEVKSRKKNQNSLLDQLNSEYAEIERQITELVSLLPQTKHQRPILAHLDQLEEERMEIVDKIAEE